jgi:hypothetical protein
MGHSEYYLLLNRGRKAGLGTAEVYHPLATLPTDRSRPSGGQPDTNDYISGHTDHGAVEYYPLPGKMSLPKRGQGP